MSKIFIRIAAVILAAGLVLAGCENPAGGGQEQQQGSPPDTSALTAAIEAAEAAKAGIREAADESEAAAGIRWATPAQLTTLNTAIAAANSAKSSATTQTAVDDALSALNEAIAEFNEAVDSNPDGTKTTGFTQEDFDALIAQAKAAADDIIVDTNANDVSPNVEWVTQAVLDALEDAIEDAEAVTALTDPDYQALQEALDTFDQAKQDGASTETAKEALNNAIEAAAGAQDGVAIAPDAAHAPSGSAWVTQEQWNDLNTPYTAAEALIENEDATKNAVDAAASALTAAITAFNTAKTTNGPGEGTSGVFTITGLSAIYDNGTEVRVGFYTGRDDNGLSGPVFADYVTVTGGSLTVAPDVVPGSYHVSFMADDRTFVFVSNAAITFGVSAISKSYDDFGLLAHPFRLGNEGFTSSGTLDDFFQSKNYTGYAGFMNEWSEDLEESLDPNLHDLIDCKFYTTSAFTQEFSGSTPVDGSTVVYCKMPLTSDYRGAQVGQISGSITLTNVPPNPGRLSIKAGNDEWHSYTSINPSDIGNGGVLEWTIPLCEFDAGNWEDITETQSASFSLHFGNDGELRIDLGSRNLNMADKANITVQPFGAVSLGTITLSGTISLTVTNTDITLHRVKIIVTKSGESSRLTTTEINEIAGNSLSGVQWSASVRPFDDATDVTISVKGYDEAGDEIFYKGDVKTVEDVHNTNRSGITFDIGTFSLITLSGTINVTYNGVPVPRVNISPSVVGVGSTRLNAPGPDVPWSITMAALDAKETVTFYINGHNLSDKRLFERFYLSPTQIHDSDKTDIVLDLGNITIGGGALGMTSSINTSSVTSNSITLSWSAVSDAASYNIYRSTSQFGEYTKVNTSPIQSEPYNDTGLAANTPYWYRVAAVASDGGEGPWSWSLSAFTSAP
jgi:hypothetical protein